MLAKCNKEIHLPLIRRSFIVALVSVVLLLVSVSCDQGIIDSGKYSTPTIKGTISIPSGVDVKASDIWIKVVCGESTAYVGRVGSDGSFVVSNLDESKVYSVCFTSIEPDHDNVSKGIDRGGNGTGYGGWLSNVTAAVNEGNNVGSVKMKPLGTIQGVAQYTGQNEHYDIWVYIPGTSYMARTAADGSYSITNVPQGTHTLRFTAEGYLAQMQSDVVLRSDSDTEGPTASAPKVILLNKYGTVKGRVTLDGNSDSFTGINVKLVNLDGSESFEGSSSADGTFVISNVTPGTYVVLASYLGYIEKTTTTFNVLASQVYTIPDFSLTQRGGDIVGSVSISEADSFALVTVWATGSDGLHKYSTSSEADGSYKLINCYPGVYELSFTKADYADLVLATQYEVVAGETVSVPAVMMQKTKGVITGTVRLSDVENASGIRVSIPKTDYFTETDEFGRYTIKVPQGNYKGLVFSKDCYNTAQSDVDISVFSDNTFQINPVVLTEAHHWNDGVESVTPTHTEDGEKVFTCTECGLTKTETIPAFVDDHTYSEDWSADETYHWHAATCGHEIESDKALHSWVEEETITEPTHLAEGKTKYKCTVCGETEIRSVEKIPHNYESSITKKATCEEEGVRTYHCDECGDEYTEPISALGHFATTFTIVSDATCHEVGQKTYVCLRCGKDVCEEIPIKDHVPVTAADSGNHWIACALCGDVLNKKTAHDFESVGGDFVCKDCGYSESSLYFQIVDGVLTLKDNTVLPPEVRVPLMIDGEVAEAIGDSTFENCDTLVKITIPKGIERIGTSVFKGCDKLETIVFTGSKKEWNAIEKPNKWFKDVPATEVTCSDGLVKLGELSIPFPQIEYEWIPNTSRYSVKVESWCAERFSDTGTTVYYTTDGSEPSKNSDIFDSTVVAEEGTVFRLIAILDSDNSQYMTWKDELPIVPDFTRGPAGGWIVYDKGDYSNGWRYLEIAPYDMVVVNGEPAIAESGSSRFFIMGYGKDPDTGEVMLACTERGIGTGYENTQKLYELMGDKAYVAVDSDETTDLYAARLVSLLEYNGYDDWFIPSHDEWECVRKAIGIFGVGNLVNDDNHQYWGSSEYPIGGDVNYPTVNPTVSRDLGQGERAKNSLRVRPMRRY